MSRRAGLRRLIRRDPDYTVSATITTPDGSVVPDVPCRVYLPRSVIGRPYLEFDLSEGQTPPLTVPEFSVQGHAEVPNGAVVIHSDIVLTEGWSEERWGSKFIKCTLPGEPWDLEITERRDARDDSEINTGMFWLTANKLLTPFVMPLFSNTGEVKIKTAREVAFQLPTALVHFRKYFRHERKKAGVLTTSELVAEFEGSIARERFKEIVQEVDDLLLLTSLATRHRCVCRGWNTHTDNSQTQFYRNRLAVPKARKISAQETLINDPDFKDFLKHAFPAFRQNAGREALRQAIDLLVSSQEGTIEASFLKCFAAVETLVTYFRESHGLTAILDPDQWASFEKDLTSFIKKHPLFKDDESTGRRKLIYEKRSELNRIAFGTAYRQTAESLGKHGFHDDDLWPIVGSSRGLSLAEIRNRIVHGVVFTPPKQESLFRSLIHLRWCAERMIVAFLEWPVEHEVTIRFDERLVKYDFGELDEVALAYAITIHKSQGSEFPAVVIPLATQHYMLLQRNLIYTGITRGKRLLVLIGQKKALGIAVRNDRPQRRYSGLLTSLRSDKREALA
jgi:hypothetical protein